MDQGLELQIPNEFRSVRERLLGEFSKKGIEGINTDRVENFIRRQGLEVKPYIIFSPEQLPQIKNIEGNTNLTRSSFDKGAKGVYLPEIDMVLVMRERVRRS